MEVTKSGKIFGVKLTLGCSGGCNGDSTEESQGQEGLAVHLGGGFVFLAADGTQQMTLVPSSRGPSQFYTLIIQIREVWMN